MSLREMLSDYWYAFQQELFPRLNSEPDRIGRNASEVAVEQIGRDRMGVAAVGGDRRPPPASRWTNAVLPA